MERNPFDWRAVPSQHLGKWAEYFVKMEFARAGLDVYASEVDDRGIDFVVRRAADRYFDVQVKAVRGLSYVFMSKSKFDLRDNLLLALVLAGPDRWPDLYLIPARAWQSPNALFVGRDYGEGKKSPPEWGLNLSSKNLPLLAEYRFEDSVRAL